MNKTLVYKDDLRKHIKIVLNDFSENATGDEISGAEWFADRLFQELFDEDLEGE